MSPRPTEDFGSIMRFVRFITSCVGANAYDANYRINCITIATVIIILFYILFTTLTVFKESNWMYTLEAISMAGSVVQGINKMVIGVFSHRKVYELNQLIIRIYEEYELHDDPRFAQALLKTSRKLRRVIHLVGMSYLLGIVGMLTTPMLAWKKTGEVYLIMHYHIPGIDVETPLGAWITQAVHAASCIVGATGMYAGDMVIIVHLLQAYVFADVLRLKVDILNKCSDTEEAEDESAQNENSKILIDISRWHQTYLIFIAQCNDLFYSIVSTQVASSVVCILLTTFVLIRGNWPGGYCYIFLLYPNMYVYCILGTMLENCNDDIMYEIYNIYFYNLKISQQRIVLFMLAKSQRPYMIRLLGVMPLAVNTALLITKNIYSITMMMMKFL